MKRSVSCLLLLSLPLLTHSIADAQDSAGKPTSDVRSEVQKMVEGERMWGPESSTANMSLTLYEKDRIESNGYTAQTVPANERFRTTIAFNLRTTGAPKDKTYALVTWPVNAKSPGTLMKNVTLDLDGTAYRGIAREHPIELPMRTAPGEPVRLGLVSTDNTVKIFAKVVPVPLAGKDHGCIVNATLLTPNAQVVMFEGTGFQPNVEIVVRSASGKEVRNDTKHADANGKFMTVDLPFVEGVDHGNVKMTLKSPQCSPSVTVAWGKQ